MGLLVARRGLLAAGAAPDVEPEPPGDDYGDVVAADGPTWWLRLEETSGSVASDEVGTNDGTVVGANLDVASFVPSGSAAGFDGLDDRIDVDHDALLNAGDMFTVECLVRLDDPDAEVLQTVMDKIRLTSSNLQWTLFWDNRSNVQRLRVNVYGATSNAGRYRAEWEGDEARDALAAGVHLVGTFDVNRSRSVELRANGTRVALSDAGATVAPDDDNTLDLHIGHSDETFWLGGIIDEPAIYDKVLAADRITVHADAVGLVPEFTAPDDLFGLVGWWKADSLDLSDTDPVAQWDDESGAGNHMTQGTASKQPTFRTDRLNSLPAVNFDGSGDELGGSLADSISGSRTVFVVVENPINDSNVRPFVAGNNLLMAKWTNDDRWIMGRSPSTGEYLDFFDATVLGDPAYWTLVQHDDTFVRLNGTQEASGDVGLPTLSSLVFGSRPGASVFFAGDLHEVILYDRPLEADEIEAVEGYLADKWGLI